MRIILLQRWNGDYIYLNVDKIETFTEREINNIWYTAIYLSGSDEYLLVRQSPNEVLQKIKEAEE